MAIDSTDPDEPDDDDDVPDASKRAGTAGDVDEVIRLLTWARVKGYAIPQLRVGAVTLVARDLRPRLGDPMTPAQEAQDIWAEHGLSKDDR